MSSKKILVAEEESSEEVSSSNEDASDDESIQEADHEEKPAIKQMMIPMMAIFQAYGAYVVMQRFLKSALHANHSQDEEKAALFTLSTTLMHWGKLVMRVGHDFLLPCLSSQMRVAVSMLLVMLGLLVPPVFVFGLGLQWMGFAFLHFSLLGMGVGIFEGVYLSVISPLGPRTKFWAVLGPPLGFATVNIAGQVVTSLGVPPVALYVYSALCLPIGLAVFWWQAPSAEGGQRKPANFGEALRHGRAWLPGMLPFFLAKLVGCFVMDNTPGWFYVFNDNTGVPFWGPRSTTLINHDLYFAAVNLCVFLGDTFSRRMPYCLDMKAPGMRGFLLTMSIVTSAFGFFLESYAIAALTLFAGFIAFWGNGLNYAVGAQYIDKSIPAEYTRAVYSLWCMIGDLGGVLGSSMIDLVNAFFCPHSYPHECLH